MMSMELEMFEVCVCVCVSARCEDSEAEEFFIRVESVEGAEEVVGWKRVNQSTRVVTIISSAHHFLNRKYYIKYWPSVNYSRHLENTFLFHSHYAP